MAKPLSVSEALVQLNERLGKYTNPHTNKPQRLSRAAFHNSVLPEMKKRGDAYRIGNQWVIDPKDWWMWTTYAEGRANLISDGRWIARRPWSVEDMEAVAMDLIEYD